MTKKIEHQISQQLKKGRKNSEIIQQLLNNIHTQKHTSDDKISILSFVQNSGQKSLVIRTLREWPDKEGSFPWSIGLEVLAANKVRLDSPEAKTLIHFLKSKKLHPFIGENYSTIHPAFEDYRSAHLDYLSFKSSKVLKLMWDKLFFLQQRGILNEEIKTIKQLLKYDSENPKLKQFLNKVKSKKEGDEKSNSKSKNTLTASTASITSAGRNTASTQNLPDKTLAPPLVDIKSLNSKILKPQTRELKNSDLGKTKVEPSNHLLDQITANTNFPLLPPEIENSSITDKPNLQSAQLPPQKTETSKVTNTTNSSLLDVKKEYRPREEFKRPHSILTEIEKTTCENHLKYIQKTLPEGHTEYFDLAFHFYSLNAFHFGLKCIELAPEGVNKGYLKVQFLFLSQRYLEAIHFAQEFSQTHNHDLDILFHCLFYQAESFWELGKTEEALDCIQTLVNENPDYRNAEVILNSWRKSLT